MEVVFACHHVYNHSDSCQAKSKVSEDFKKGQNSPWLGNSVTRREQIGKTASQWQGHMSRAERRTKLRVFPCRVEQLNKEKFREFCKAVSQKLGQMNSADRR